MAKEQRKSTRVYIVVAILGSLIWLVLAGPYLYSIRTWFSTADPNNVGDLLAGIFTPLAVLWLIAGYFMQARELAYQIDEIKKSVQAQTMMAKVSQETHARELALSAPHLRVWQGGYGGHNKMLHLSVKNLGEEDIRDLRIEEVLGRGKQGSNRRDALISGQQTDLFVEGAYDEAWIKLEFMDRYKKSHFLWCYWEEHPRGPEHISMHATNTVPWQFLNILAAFKRGENHPDSQNLREALRRTFDES